MDTLVILIFVVALFLAFPVFFRGAIYLPTRRETVRSMIELAKIKAGDIAADLGSGDGRLVIALAESGIEAHGFEINPVLVLLSRWLIRKRKLKDKAFIHFGNFWKEDLSKYSIVTIFGIGFAMEKLEKKLEKELKKGTRIISNSFVFPNWKVQGKKDTAFLYIKL